MLNFLGYMLFSSLEYCAIFLFMLSVFTFDLGRYKKEFTFVVFSMTLLSYFLVILNLQNTVPLPLIMIPCMILVTVKVFKQKLKMAIVAVIGGTVIYGAMQYAILSFAIHLGYLSVDDLSQVFAIKSYIFQTLSATIAISIAIYIRIFNGGFGFALRVRKKKYKAFVISFIISFLLSCLSLLSFEMSNQVSYLTILVITLIISSLIIIYLSHRRDHIEYT